MANALVVRRSLLPKSVKNTRAAQYVRMSTDYQRYSIENQAVAIAAYAQTHGLSIVRTYRDEGESGLTLRNRAGLIQLLDDVQSDNIDFDHILIFDVSRWGRFQDVDESAHYEFICKRAGIKIAYCAEQFENDGSMLSSIVKNLKRVMAAEYSRELSAKVYAGVCRLVQLGYTSGGGACYGIERLLVDEKMQPKTVLKQGDRKYFTAHHVRLRPGPAHEVETVRRIFQEFLQMRSESAIARDLNRDGVANGTRKPWDRGHIGRILRNENYIGNVVYNRRSKKLGGKNVYNAPDQWIRGEGFVEPIIGRDVFLRAKQIIAERRITVPEPEMLLRLRKTLMKKGKLSPAIINETVGLPSTATYIKYFGSLRETYRLIGYKSRRNCEYIDTRRKWSELTAQLASEVIDRLKHSTHRQVTSAEGSLDCIRISKAESVSFRFARWQPGKIETHSPHWAIKRRVDLLPGWVVVVRLNEHNEEVLDYILLRSTDIKSAHLRFSEQARIDRGFRNFDNFSGLVRSLIRRLSRESQAHSAKPRQQERGRTKPMSKSATNRVRP